MPKFRFVHAADLHLDSPFRGIPNEAPAHVAQTLSNATFDAYRNIIDLRLQEEVDALLVAGDIYDGADRSLRAQLRFVDGLKQLDRAGTRSFICHGNHDPLDGWEARLDLPESCVRFGPEVAAFPLIPDEPERATVYGISYPTREMRDNLTPLFTAANANFNIGLLHANVGGNPDHDSYAPCSVSDLADTGFDYWALGHVHTRQMLRERGPAIVYPGNPRSAIPTSRERGASTWWRWTTQGAVHLDFRPTDVVRWETLSLDIGPLDSEQALLDAADDLAEEALSVAQGRSVVARLELVGRGGLHRSLNSRDTARVVRERLNDQYTERGTWLWCEGVRLATASPVDRAAALRREDFVGDLIRLSTDLKEDGQGLAALRESLQPLYSNSRRELRNLLQHFVPSDAEIEELLANAEEECLAALADEEEVV